MHVSGTLRIAANWEADYRTTCVLLRCLIEVDGQSEYYHHHALKLGN